MNDNEYKRIGEDVRIDDMCRITRPNLVELGNHIAIDMCVYASTQMVLGDYIHIAPHVSIIGGAESKLVMGHFSAIGSGSKILCGSDDFEHGIIGPFIPDEFRKVMLTTVTFEDHACLGVNCVVMPGVTLAEGSVVGSNSVVTKDTEPWTVYVGSPARPIKKRNKEFILESAKKMGYE